MKEETLEDVKKMLSQIHQSLYGVIQEIKVECKDILTDAICLLTRQDEDENTISERKACFYAKVFLADKRFFPPREEYAYFYIEGNQHQGFITLKKSINANYSPKIEETTIDKFNKSFLRDEIKKFVIEFYGQ